MFDLNRPVVSMRRKVETVGICSLHRGVWPVECEDLHLNPALSKGSVRNSGLYRGCIGLAT